MIKALLKKEIGELFSALFRDPKTGKNRVGGGLILYAILYLYVVAIFLFVFGFLALSFCASFGESGIMWLYFAIAGIMATLLGVIGSVAVTQSKLYTAKDNDQLLSLPIRPSAILFARMISLYVWVLVFEWIVLLPFGVVYCIFNGINIVFVLEYILMLFIVPLFGFGIVCILGFILALFMSKFKKKNIVTVVFMVAFIGVYFYFYSQMETYISLIVENAEKIGESVMKYFYPYYVLGKGLDGDIVSFLIAFLILAGFFALVYFILSKTYIKIVTTKKGSAKTVYKEKKLSESSPIKAFFMKELKTFTGSSAYMINCGIGTLMLFAVTILAIVKKSSIINMGGEEGIVHIVELAPLLALAAAAFMSSVAPVTAPSISLEGKTLWILKALPVRYKDVLTAKLLLQVAVVSIPSFICVVIYGIVMGSGILLTLLCALTAFMIGTAFGEVGLICNIKKPLFTWTNETAVVKQGTSILITMLINMGASLLFIAIGAIASIFISPFAGTCSVLVIALIGFVIMYRWIITGGVKAFEKF